MSNTEIEYNGRFNEKEVCLVSVRELLFQSKSFEFLIPSYQRGYRWGKLQVKQFITDILNEIDGYCIQVLTIKKNNNKNQYEVIDGQQRLTCIFIIASALSFIYKKSDFGLANKCYLEYESRSNSKKFIKFLSCLEKENIKNIKDFLKGKDKNKTKYEKIWKRVIWKKFKEENPKVSENLDFRYMAESFITCIEIFIDLDLNQKEENIKNKLLNCQFIWYPLVNDIQDERENFLNLNMGKVELTNSELIKAEILNPSNIMKEKQKLIAMKLDYLEHELKKIGFWTFIPHEKQYELRYKSRTRIDILFEYFIINNLAEKNLIRKDVIDKYMVESQNSDYFLFNKIKHIIEDNTGNVKYTRIDELVRTIYDIYEKLKEVYIDDKIYNHDSGEEKRNIGLYNFISLIVYLGKDRCFIKVYNEIKQIISKNRNEQLQEIKEILKKYISSRDIIKEMRYKNTKIKDIILLFNTILLSRSKGIGNRYNFFLHSEQKWSIEHIFPQKFISEKDEERNKKLKLNSKDLMEAKMILELLTKDVNDNVLNLEKNYMFNYINFLYGKEEDCLIDDIRDSIIENYIIAIYDKKEENISNEIEGVVLDKKSKEDINNIILHLKNENLDLSDEQLKKGIVEKIRNYEIKIKKINLDVQYKEINSFIEKFKEKTNKKYEYDYARHLKLIQLALVYLEKIHILEKNKVIIKDIVNNKDEVEKIFKNNSRIFYNKTMKVQIFEKFKECTKYSINNSNFENEFIILSSSKVKELQELQEKYDVECRKEISESKFIDNIENEYANKIKDIFYSTYNSLNENSKDDENKFTNKFIKLIIETSNDIIEQELKKFFIGNSNNMDNFNYLIKDDSIGNLALLDKKTNESEEIGNNSYNEKKKAIYRKMKEDAFIPLSTLLVFTNVYSNEFSNNKYWLYESRYNYLNEIINTVSDFWGDIK